MSKVEKLFGSLVRVKLLKFLFRNYPGNFKVHELSRKIQESPEKTKKELEFLSKIGLINKS